MFSRLVSYLYLQDFDQDGSGPSDQELNETEKADHAAREGPPSEISITETSETKAPSAVRADKVPYNNLRVYMAADKWAAGLSRVGYHDPVCSCYGPKLA